ncbi:MAG: galactosyltransferase-related protein [Bacteroidia bacterium]
MSKDIKSILPVWLKLLPWYIFKSPQRQLGLKKTWLTELKGISHFAFKRLLNPRKQELQPLSICTGIKNRTKNYLDFVLPSVLKMNHQHLIELSVFDCGSEDVENFEKEIRKRWQGKLTFVTEEHKFTRSFSFNQAIDQASNELIFGCDADLDLPVDLVEQCNKYVTKKTVWFPIFFNLYENKPAVLSNENGHWFPLSFGMFACTKAQFIKIGRFNEIFIRWGGEDDDLWMRFHKYGFLPIRTRCKGLFHHYHPTARPADYVPIKIEY